MTRKLVKKIRGRRARETEDCAREIAATPERDVSERLARIERYDTILAALPSGNRAPAIAVAIACVAIVGILWSVRVPRVNCSVRVEGDAVRLVVDGPVRWQGPANLGDGTVAARYLSAMDAGRLGTLGGDDSEGETWVDVQAERVTLVDLDIQPGCELTLDAGEPGRLDVYGRAGEIRGKLRLQGKARIAAGPEGDPPTIVGDATLIPPELLSFRAAGSGVTPSRVSLARPRGMVLRNVPIRDLQLSREVSTGPGSWEFVSTVQSGSVVVHGSGDGPVTLQEQDALTLTGARGRIVELRIDDRIHVLFEGTAESILHGPRDFPRDLAPSMLTYLRHSRPVQFFWSSLVFVWGILWSARRFLKS